MRQLICALLLEIGALNVIGQCLFAKLCDLEQVAADKPRES